MKINLLKEEIEQIAGHIENDACDAYDKFTVALKIDEAVVMAECKLVERFNNGIDDPVLARQCYDVELEDAWVVINGVDMEIENIERLREEVEKLDVQY